MNVCVVSCALCLSSYVSGFPYVARIVRYGFDISFFFWNFMFFGDLSLSHTHTHAHESTLFFIFSQMCVCVMCACVSLSSHFVSCCISWIFRSHNHWPTYNSFSEAVYLPRHTHTHTHTRALIDSQLWLNSSPITIIARTVWVWV